MKPKVYLSLKRSAIISKIALFNTCTGFQTLLSGSAADYHVLLFYFNPWFDLNKYDEGLCMLLHFIFVAYIFSQFICI